MGNLQFKKLEPCFLCNTSGVIKVEYTLKRDNDQDDIEGEGEELCPMCDGCGNLKIATENK